MITTPVIEQYNRIDLPEQSTDTAQPPPEKKDRFITIDSKVFIIWTMILSVNRNWLLNWIKSCRQKASNRHSYQRGPESSLAADHWRDQHAQGKKPNQAELGHEGWLGSVPSNPSLFCIFAIALANGRV